MNSFTDYIFHVGYAKVKRLGDRLADIEPLIDREAFRPIKLVCLITEARKVVDSFIKGIAKRAS